MSAVLIRMDKKNVISIRVHPEVLIESYLRDVHFPRGAGQKQLADIVGSLARELRAAGVDELVLDQSDPDLGWKPLDAETLLNPGPETGRKLSAMSKDRKWLVYLSLEPFPEGQDAHVWDVFQWYEEDESWEMVNLIDDTGQDADAALEQALEEHERDMALWEGREAEATQQPQGDIIEIGGA